MGEPNTIRGKTHHDDVEVVRGIERPHLNAGREVVLVAHSYGGLVATDPRLLSCFSPWPLPAVLAEGQTGGALEQRYVGGPASTASPTVRDADATALRQRSPKKNKAKKPLIKANKGQSQAEQDKITAQLDAENNPQPPARAGRVLGGLRS
ncbi:hypothetical protein MCOR03_000982 [Pyricularia oryzae]|nr:hypothetical protein MCOR31_007904 [Pyricularia oryzae]KAI6406652.1 hypothetical protein MCOR20_006090 [Pyricularia oryzae]KAI6423644.1 hypothetical protein MCOR24_003671 [Pyricularia oryzae]KAI6567505.1 hypothetical protein MCOR03_000982 [Pyricularia oryzae]